MSNEPEPVSAEREFDEAEEIAAQDAIAADADPESPRSGEPEPEPGAESSTPGEEPPPAASDRSEPQSASGETESDEPADHEGEARPAPKLERLHKILAQAGIASRRRAEELIAGGHVQVNGQVVTTLGTKADPARDHIRVDGKLIHGAERLRYYMLNKPRGFVTTVNDPEGRPTVMQFFARMPERLYPVGRLDYQSEGLLLVTNDGELANRLTRAAAGVEKTYLVKVSGRPTEDELETLRHGVSIDREQPGSGKVRTAPARIRQVRRGDNPWFEVVLAEGRNRELRKMFSEIGHFVEKIRRVGYGPLILDIEPGKLRELEPAELTALRAAAEGKLKPRRLDSGKFIPREAGRPAQDRPGSAPAGRDDRPPRRQPGRRAEARPQPAQDRRREGRQKSSGFRSAVPPRRPSHGREENFAGPPRKFANADRRKEGRSSPSRNSESPSRGFGRKDRPDRADRGAFDRTRREESSQGRKEFKGFAPRPPRRDERENFAPPSRTSRPPRGEARERFAPPSRSDRPPRRGPGESFTGSPRGDRPRRGEPGESFTRSPRGDRPRGRQEQSPQRPFRGDGRSSSPNPSHRPSRPPSDRPSSQRPAPRSKRGSGPPRRGKNR
jgi:23S rRNA pseudouridine2605 synthase